MFNARRLTRIALYIAAVGSFVVAVFFTAAALGIWTENLHFHPTPRINSLTVGRGLVPIPAVAWIVYVWTRTRQVGFPDIAFRILVSGALLWAAYYFVLSALIAAYFVG